VDASTEVRLLVVHSADFEHMLIIQRQCSVIDI